ncbi:hypothetical protein EVAR_51971_1 [Eumeta japonica]|uniref:Uncharacterized protein n=1 Tax=Eumeta variegata TaxID=151549 RepID=A0A4C1Y1R0_EUMVA|nr:hypothetical protein EVAR_51971_1 [Eumeta japonica]
MLTKPCCDGRLQWPNWRTSTSRRHSLGTIYIRKKLEAKRGKACQLYTGECLENPKHNVQEERKVLVPFRSRGPKHRDHVSGRSRSRVWRRCWFRTRADGGALVLTRVSWKYPGARSAAAAGRASRRYQSDFIDDENESETTMDEIIKALKRMKVGQAAKFDRLTLEMLRGGGDTVAILLYQLFNKG